jgi:hypothetical protein
MIAANNNFSFPLSYLTNITRKPYLEPKA